MIAFSMLFRKRPFWVEKILYGFHSPPGIAIRIFQKLRGGQKKKASPTSFSVSTSISCLLQQPGLIDNRLLNHLISISIDCRLPS